MNSPSCSPAFIPTKGNGSTIALALIATLATACVSAGRAAGPQIHSATSPDVGLIQYRAFSFGLALDPKPAYEVSPQSLEMDRHMRTFISSVLLQKGYVEDNINPNFIVRFGAGTKKLDSGADPSWSSGVDDNVDVHRIDVEVYDAFTRTQVWTGSVTWKHDLREKTYDGLFPRDVQSLLATFPVRSPEANDCAKAGAGAEAALR
jgi:hypothetical protein